MHSWERVMDTLSVRRPQPHNTNPQKERRERQYKTKKKSEQLRPIKSINPALETCQSHTIEYRVSKNILQRYWEENKSHAVLAPYYCEVLPASRSISILMCDQYTTCNHGVTRTAWHRLSTTKRMHRVTPDLIQHTTDRLCAMSHWSTPPLKIWRHWLQGQTA